MLSEEVRILERGADECAKEARERASKANERLERLQRPLRSAN
jgi:hypothetical protein